MPTLTGTLTAVTGGPIDPARVRRAYVRASQRRGSLGSEGALVTTVPVPVSTTGELSIDLDPGPAILVVETLDGGPDVFDLYVTADMTLISEALAESAPPHERSWVESQMVQLRGETVTAAAEADTAKGAAEVAASAAESHRDHVDSIRETLDEAAQNNVAPYLTQSELNATYVSTDVALPLSSVGTPSTSEDHTQKIQAALNSGHKTIVVTPGTWNFTALTVPSGVTITGGGGTLRLRDGTTADTTKTYYPILIPNTSVDAGIIGVTIDGNMQNNPSPVVADTITAAGDRTRVQDNVILNSVDSGIMFSRATNSMCTGNRIDGGRDVGIYVNDGADGTAFSENVIRENIISGFKNGGIALKRSVSKCTVNENMIFDCGNGITLEQASESADYSTNMTICNNRLRNIGQTNPDPAASVGINLRGSKDCIVSGNRMENITFRGIYIQGTVRTVVSGNHVSWAEDAVQASISAGVLVDQRSNVGGCENLSIVGNVIVGAPRQGIYLIGLSAALQRNIALTGNVVVNSRLAALRVDAHNKGLSIVGNTLHGTLADVEVYAGAEYTAASNVLVTGATSGAWFQVGMGSDGLLAIGNPDTTLRRIAAGIAGANHLRLDGSLRALTSAGNNYATLGDVSLGTVGLRLADVSLYQGGAGVLRTNATSFRVDGQFGVNGALPQGKAANPGTATGPDAAVINAIVTALRNVGIVT